MMDLKSNESDPAWLDNDVSRLPSSFADWRLWPPIIFTGIFLLTLPFRVPLIASAIAGLFGAVLIAVVGYVSSRRVVVKLAIAGEDLVWIDRGGRRHIIALTRIQNVQRRQAESIIWYVDEEGKRDGFGVGPKATEAVEKALSR